jgi:polyphosphate kinase
LFNHLSGYTKHNDYSTLLVAPDTMRDGIIAMIDREADHARAGEPSGIWMKVNSLVDEQVIDALYAASAGGVPIGLVVRGMCALRPGVIGLSPSIRVKSIVGRFLEHSRIFRFHNGGADDVWIGSADMMHRNLDRRVEALVRLQDEQVRDQVCALVALALDDAVAGWQLQQDGSWRRQKAAADGQRLADFQDALIRQHTQRKNAARDQQRVS